MSCFTAVKVYAVATILSLGLGFGGMHLTHYTYHKLRANLVYPHPSRDAEVRKTDRDVISIRITRSE